MERCPNCRARNGTDAECCRRCGMELTLPRRAERAAEALLRRAVAELASGDEAAAEARLEQSRHLRADPLTEHLLGMVRSRRRGARGDRPPRP